MAIMRDLSYRCLSHPAANGSCCRWRVKRVEVIKQVEGEIFAVVESDANF
jgi:hypothetical protein